MLLKDLTGLRETYLLIESIESIGSEDTCRYRECVIICVMNALLFMVTLLMVNCSLNDDIMIAHPITVEGY